MGLAPDARVDPYAEVAQNGAGGMGEAQVLASLNHPHIATIYGFENAGGTTALVLELVDGETLADRIARGPIPVDAALSIASQIARALEAAHEQGITAVTFSTRRMSRGKIPRKNQD